MSLVEAFLERSKLEPEKIIIKQLLPATDSDREFKAWTTKKFKEETLNLAAYLQQYMLGPACKVAILSNTRPEWLIADFAIMFNAGVSVSVYQTLTADEIAYILYDSTAEIIFVENQEQLDKVLNLIDRKINIPAVEDRPAVKTKLDIKKIITFEKTEEHALVTYLGDVLLKPTTGVTFPAIKDQALASLVYTSGTTGQPKGVMQTHLNHLANLRQVEESGIVDNDPAIFLFLPLAHSFAKLMGYLGVLSAGCSLKFPAVYDQKSSKFQPEKITQDMRDANANIYPVVPRILEKIEAALKEKSARKDLSGILLNYAISSACIYPRNLFWETVYKLTGFIRRKIKAGIFGNNLYFVVSGGAKLSPVLNSIYENIGIKVLQGYGLTETCVATNINRPDKNYIGTVGPVLTDDIRVKIADDGEILFKGPNVTSGYWRREQATSESWDRDGWFHTGDLGSLDENECLCISGRKKELIVSSYGKKIAPVTIEDKLMQSQYITNAVLFGNDRPYCVALIVSTETDYSIIQKEIEQVNTKLASYEEVKRFFLISEDFSIENGILTPTLKIKRKVVEERYKKEIDNLYNQES